MNPSRRRAPLSDLSNLSPSPSQSGTSTFRSSSAQKLFRSKPINAENILHEKAPFASDLELSSDGRGQDAAATLSASCRTPLSAAMEVDPRFATPRAMEMDEPASSSSKEESFITYSRRKAAGPFHLTMSCAPPRYHHNKSGDVLKRSNRRRAVKRGFSAAMFGEGGAVKGVPSSSRRHSLPNLHPKQWLPEEFVAAQRSHFAEIDAFELSEEEGELSDEG